VSLQLHSSTASPQTTTPQRDTYRQQKYCGVDVPGAVTARHFSAGVQDAGTDFGMELMEKYASGDFDDEGECSKYIFLTRRIAFCSFFIVVMSYFPYSSSKTAASAPF
jgi:hypothetical protein